MFDLDRFQEIWVTITRNKVRSFLTGFGVFWGIFMLMIMLGAGTGLQRGMLKNLEGFATNSCFMGASTTSQPYKGFQKGRNWSVRDKDVGVILHTVPEIEHLSPMIFGGRRPNNIIYNDNYGSFQIKGVYSNFNGIETQKIVNGRFINEIDNLEERKICVIGSKVYEELFPTKENAVGKYVKMWGVYFQIVGVSEGGSNISINGRSAESVFVPFKTLQKIINQGDVIHMLAATAKPNIPVSVMESKMKEILKANNNIAPSDEQAVWSVNLESQFNVFKYWFLGIAIVIWIVGSGTLIAGIIGVSNIMLVTVKERTKEIGIRRALGAKPRTIIGQIMWESLVLTAIAGILGLCLGVLCLYMADTYWVQNAENIYISDPMVSFSTAVVSTIILLIFGIIAGMIPASRAMKIKAIEAIQEE